MIKELKRKPRVFVSFHTQDRHAKELLIAQSKSIGLVELQSKKNSVFFLLFVANLKHNVSEQKPFAQFLHLHQSYLSLAEVYARLVQIQMIWF